MVIFTIAVWVDPAQPVRGAAVGYVLLGGFLLWGALNIWASFKDWWLEFRLARPALAIDVAMGIGSVYFTEGLAQDFAMPLAAFLVFTLVEAIVVGGWRTALAAGLTFTLGHAAFGGLVGMFGDPIGPIHIGRGVGFFFVITALAVWLGGRQTAPAVPAFAAAPRLQTSLPVAEALVFARQCLEARSGIAMWALQDGSGVELATSEADNGLRWNVDPAAIDTLGSVGVMPSLFRVGRDHTLTLDAHDRYRPGRADSLAVLGLLPPGTDAVSLPVTTGKARIVFVLARLRTASRDLLPIARAAGHEIEAGLAKHELATRDFEDRLNDVRVSIARDLHDSVAQSLAGASFRVGAARRFLVEGDALEVELSAVHQALLSEQRHVRTIIERLRKGNAVGLRHDLLEDLAALLDELREQWRLQVAYARPPGVFNVGTTRIHELRQIAREAVANASRHGKANRIHFTVTIERDTINLDIVDDGDGGGKAGPAQAFRPRSIAERVAALGGTLDARQGPAGARLYITIPGLGA